LQGEDLASLKQGAGLKKGVWIAYPFFPGDAVRVDVRRREGFFSSWTL